MFFLDFVSQNEQGDTTLCIASKQNDVKEVARLIKLAKEHNFLPYLIDKVDKGSRTPLWAASIIGHLNIVKHILENQANVNLILA